MRKNIIKISKILFFLLVLFFVYFCSDRITDADEEIYGLTGHVVDTLGNPINGVDVFCLYYSYSVPKSVQKLSESNSLNKNSDFDFELFQNYPNPFSSSTYIRYSLPQKCQVELRISQKNGKQNVYIYNNELLNGYYQQFLGNIVDNLQLENGIYIFNLEAIGEDQTEYIAQKEIFVISDRGKANAKTNENGKFTFNFEDAFVSDSVVVNLYDSGYYMYTSYLTSKVNLLFKKSGYQSKLLTVELYPNILLTQDVVMFKGE
jgi:hypothetical protein